MTTPAPDGGAARSVTLGILLCDHMSREILGDAADELGGYDGLFIRLFGAAAAADGIDLETRTYDVAAGDMPDHTADADGWLITGSRLAVYGESEWIAGLEAFVRSCVADGVALLGVCFGHQLIAQALGGTVIEAPNGWDVGVIDYEATADADPAMPDGFAIIGSHQDQVVALPPGAVTTVTAPNCPIAGFAFGAKVATVQGHPEFLKANTEPLVRSRLDLIGQERALAGIATLDRPTDGLAVARWMLGILAAGRES